MFPQFVRLMQRVKRYMMSGENSFNFHLAPQSEVCLLTTFEYDTVVASPWLLLEFTLNAVAPGPEAAHIEKLHASTANATATSEEFAAALSTEAWRTLNNEVYGEDAAVYNVANARSPAAYAR